MNLLTMRSLPSREQVNKLIREGDMVPLVIEQDDKLEVALGETEWPVGSKLICLLHDSTPPMLKRLSGARKPSRQLLKPIVEKDAVEQASADKSADKADKGVKSAKSEPVKPEPTNPSLQNLGLPHCLRRKCIGHLHSQAIQRQGRCTASGLAPAIQNLLQLRR